MAQNKLDITRQAYLRMMERASAQQKFFDFIRAVLDQGVPADGDEDSVMRYLEAEILVLRWEKLNRLLAKVADRTKLSLEMLATLHEAGLMEECLQAYYAVYGTELHQLTPATV